MRRLSFAVLSIAALAACGQPAEIEIADVWTRASVGNSPNSAVFMTISSPTEDRLVGASTSVAEKTDLMTMTGEGGAMEMIYVDGIAIPANTPVTLDPSGLHVWLAGLHQPLEAGATFPLLLEFENAGERQVTVSIIAPAAASPMADMDM